VVHTSTALIYSVNKIHSLSKLVTEELHNLKSWFSIPTVMKSVVSYSFYSGNGYITTKTLREILSALDDKLGPEDLDGIIAEIDTDGSGTVDFDGELNTPSVCIPSERKLKLYTKNEKK